MTRFDKIRHHCLREAVRQLACDCQMQSQPFLLGFLQNLVDVLNRDAADHKQLESEVRNLRQRLARLTHEEVKE